MAKKKDEKSKQEEETKAGKETTAAGKEKKSQESGSEQLSSQEIISSIFDFLVTPEKSSNYTDFKNKIIDELNNYLKALAAESFSEYHSVYLWSESSVSDFHLDQVHRSLKKNKKESEISGEKDVLLILNSPGGSIEPAYKISKICNQLKNQKFVVAVPRRAKSAATLISMGANEIHMGLLSELGPIDPQLNGLPALGVKDAFHTLAQVVSKYPGSTELFSNFITDKINLHILGWLTRVPLSAAQYAQKLLNINYSHVGESKIKTVSDKLVEEYKTHGFVIDHEEAQKIFQDIDPNLIHVNTGLIDILENLHSNISLIEILINSTWSKPDTSIEVEITGCGHCRLFERVRN